MYWGAVQPLEKNLCVSNCADMEKSLHVLSSGTNASVEHRK